MCMFIGTPRQSTLGLMGMRLCVLVLSRVILVLIFVTVFARRDHMGANLDSEFCI